jgi:hypothetical protein
VVPLVVLVVVQVLLLMVMVVEEEDGTPSETKVVEVDPHPTLEVKMDHLPMVDMVWVVMDKVVTTVEVAVEDTLAVALVVTEVMDGAVEVAVATSTLVPLTMQVVTATKVEMVVKVT